MPPGSKATWAGLKEYQQKLLNSWPERTDKLESEAKETTSIYKVRRNIGWCRHKNRSGGGGVGIILGMRAVLRRR